MVVPSPVGDVKIVCPISTFVLNTLTLKKSAICLSGIFWISMQHVDQVGKWLKFRTNGCKSVRKNKNNVPHKVFSLGSCDIASLFNTTIDNILNYDHANFFLFKGTVRTPNKM